MTVVDLAPWEFDTPGTADYPVGGRGWAAEVMPEPLTPLTVTAFLPAYERAWRRQFSTFRVMDTFPAEPLFAEVFRGRFYCNTTAAHTGGGPADRLLGGRVRPFSAPPDAEVEAGMERAMARRHRRRAARATDSVAGLVAGWDDIAADLEDTCYLHMVIAGLARALFTLVVRGLRDVVGDPDTERSASAGLAGRSDIQSAQPDFALESLASAPASELAAGAAPWRARRRRRFASSAVASRS